MWWLLSACTAFVPAVPVPINVGGGPTSADTDTDTGAQPTPAACPWVGEWAVTEVCLGFGSSDFDGDIGSITIEEFDGGCTVYADLNRAGGCNVQEDIRLELDRAAWVGASTGSADIPSGCFLGPADPYDLGEVTVTVDGNATTFQFETAPYVTAQCVNGSGGFTVIPSP